jgi:hypothetical protein
MGRRRRIVTIELNTLLAADGGLARQHATWTAQGYSLTSARLWQCRDGTVTARLVWRNRAEVVSTVTWTVQGIVLR